MTRIGPKMALVVDYVRANPDINKHQVSLYVGPPTGWDYPGYDDGYDPDDYLPDDYDDEDFEPDDDETPATPWVTVRELQDRLDYLGTPEAVADAVEKLIEYAPIYRDPMNGRIDPQAIPAIKAHLIRR